MSSCKATIARQRRIRVGSHLHARGGYVWDLILSGDYSTPEEDKCGMSSCDYSTPEEDKCGMSSCKVTIARQRRMSVGSHLVSTPEKDECGISFCKATVARQRRISVGSHLVRRLQHARGGLVWDLIL
ncbi:hypothetical protein RRG08_048124 [Elysia crispata]|uniref:Uncharacterized protein n=1 Tax=Elysia crispata TaxID=231223 RepID=A0AAE0ZI68_9GAST|nr:hypothetical protein RRG08_048124 [Elysia crispata]